MLNLFTAKSRVNVQKSAHRDSIPPLRGVTLLFATVADSYGEPRPGNARGVGTRGEVHSSRLEPVFLR